MKVFINLWNFVILIGVVFASEEILYSETTTGWSACEDYYAVEYDPRPGLEVTHSSETCEQVCSKYLSCESYYVTNGICIICTRQISGITEIDVSVRAKPIPSQRIASKDYQADPTVNRALGKLAIQSTTYVFLASTAVDGCLDTSVSHATCGCTHTSTEANPWWSVDLETITRVSRVVIYNRNGIGERLHDFDVTISTDNIDPSLATDSIICYAYSGASTSWAVEDLTCDQPVTGRYLSIRIGGTGTSEILTLCEVQVYE